MADGKSDLKLWFSDLDELTVLGKGEAVFFVLVMLDGTKYEITVPHKVFGGLIESLQDLAGRAFEVREKTGTGAGERLAPTQNPFPATAIQKLRDPRGTAHVLQFSSKDGRRSDIRLPRLLTDQLVAHFQGKSPESDRPPTKH